MTTLYLTRHGQTMWNVEGRMQGWQDSPLTKTGIEYAGLLGSRLQNLELEAIYSSSSGRALATAGIVKGSRKFEIITDDGLREINMGSWEGRYVEDIKAECPQRFDAFWNKPHLYIPDGGEDFESAGKRVVGRVLEIVEKHKGKNILIVSHAIAVLLVLKHFKNLPMEALWDMPFIEGTSLSAIKFEDDGAKVVLHGDMSHVEGIGA